MNVDELMRAADSWSQDRIAAEIQQRRTQIFAIAERSNDGANVQPGDVREMRTLNGEINALEERVIERRIPLYVGKGGNTGPATHGGSKYGRPEGIGQAFLDGLLRQQGGTNSDTYDLPMYAALDGTSGGTAVAPFYRSGIMELPQRGLFVRSLIPTVPVSGDKVWYVRQSVATQNAAPTAAGGLKPTSTYTVERIEATVKVIAHVSEALDRSFLSDFDQMVSFIDNQLTLGVLLAEEQEILNGDGTGQHLTGILNTSGVQIQTRGSDPVFDAIYKGITKLRVVFLEPDGIVMHPTDWQGIRLTRTADGLYIDAPVGDADDNRLFGKPVIVSSLIAQGTALVGAFGACCEIYQREDARVSFAEFGLGNNAGEEMFTRNQIRFRGESRMTLGVNRPSGFCKVTGL